MEEIFKTAMRDSLLNHAAQTNAIPNKLTVAYGESFPPPEWIFEAPNAPAVSRKDTVNVEVKKDAQKNVIEEQDGSIQKLRIYRGNSLLSEKDPDVPESLVLGATYNFNFTYSWTGPTAPVDPVQSGFRQQLARISSGEGGMSWPNRLYLYDAGGINSIYTGSVSRSAVSPFGIKYYGHVIGPSGGFTATDLWLQYLATGFYIQLSVDPAVTILEGYRADLEIIIHF